MSTAALPPLSPEEEALMHRKIDEEIAPYRAFTPAALLDAMRREAERAMRTHPDARRLLAAAVNTAAPDTSGTVRRDGARDDERGAGGGEEP